MIPAARVIGFTLLLPALPFNASAEDFADAIGAFLQQRVQVEKRSVGVVIGIVDEEGSRIVSCGKMDNGTEREVNGDTLFDIASITKPFTGLLLQTMIERGEMKLDDPVAMYLPNFVKMPARNGKEIALRHLVTHTSGLPHIAENLKPKRVDQPFADYTVEELNAFLSSYELPRDPGTKFEYSSLGAGLLGHAIALQAGSDYESLIVERICRPLKMESTRITLTPALQSRFATGHNRRGESVPSWDRETQLGGSALRSTANDLLKFVSANLSLTNSTLTPLMEKTHVPQLFHALPETDIGLAWMITRLPEGRKIVHHGGAAPGYRTFVGFDKARHRGVVVLSSSNDGFDVDAIGMLLLASEWQSAKRPRKEMVRTATDDSCVGQYQLSPDFPLGMRIMGILLCNIPRTALLFPAAAGLTALSILLWRASRARTRWIIVGCAALAGGLLAVFLVLGSSYAACALLQPTIGVRREGDRIFLQCDLRLSPLVVRSLPGAKALPRLTGELLAESESRFLERMTGIPVTFLRDRQGTVIRLTAHFLGATFSHQRISARPPEAYQPPKPRNPVALNADLLDACVGQYEFAPDAVHPAGIEVTIWREGNQLRCQARGKKTIPGPFSIYPESETRFFLPVSGANLTFVKNDKGRVTAVIVRDDPWWLPDSMGKRLERE